MTPFAAKKDLMCESFVLKAAAVALQLGVDLFKLFKLNENALMKWLFVRPMGNQLL
jgi:hypothetical protein